MALCHFWSKQHRCKWYGVLISCRYCQEIMLLWQILNYKGKTKGEAVSK